MQAGDAGVTLRYRRAGQSRAVPRVTWWGDRSDVAIARAARTHVKLALRRHVDSRLSARLHPPFRASPIPAARAPLLDEIWGRIPPARGSF